MAKAGRKPIDITGMRSGTVVAVSRGEIIRIGLQFWKCVCDCGKEL